MTRLSVVIAPQELGLGKWIQHGITKPLRVLGDRSGFNSLSCLHKNLASVAVTSCSAERAMSRVKVVTDRLRSTMLDDWFSTLLVLSTEKDLLENLYENEIIDKFALLLCDCRNT